MTSQQTELVQRMAALEEAREPYVQATVVRAQSPTSTWPGATALILADGTLEGFVGGQCAESSVRAAALEALDSGQSVLLRILPDGDESFPEISGALTVVNPCLSGGAIELFVAPHLPARRLVVIGQTPIADAVAGLAESLGFQPVRDDLVPADHEGVITVVVASHGRSETEAIRAGLDAGIGFIGLVASSRRGRAVLDELDLEASEEANVRTPVGLDIGARTPEEIALSILASVVKAIRLEGLIPPAGSNAVSTDASVPPSAIDPICGMTVVAAPPTLSLEVDGVTHWFCNPGCREQFAEQASVGEQAERAG